MMRYAMPAILIGIGVAVFFVFTNPIYNEISVLKEQVKSYDVALNNSKALESARDVLTQKQNSVNPENLAKLKKLLPENIDNIRLILEIEKIATPYGMALKDVKYNATAPKDSTVVVAPPGAVQGGVVTEPPKEYGIWDLAFSTNGSYDNFLNFLRNLENNLRIVDISSIEFSSAVGAPTKSSSGAEPTTPVAATYKYDFKIKTYWLKD